MGPNQWAIYKCVLQAVSATRVPVAAGGGFALNAYTGRWRNTKDLDLFIRGENRHAVIEALTTCGLRDYYDESAYDRSWIYRGTRDGVIVDTIWCMANHRGDVDGTWLTRGPEVCVDGVTFRLVSPEDTIWNKLFVLQRDRCDWPDGLNILASIGPELDWDYLIWRCGSDVALLSGLLSVFSWLWPDRACDLPESVWQRLNACAPQKTGPASCPRHRAHLLDSRPWFAPGEKLD